jgi:hypothetical protein
MTQKDDVRKNGSHGVVSQVVNRPDVGRVRLSAVFLTLSGLFLLAFPVVRPFGDKFSSEPMVVAATFASNSWVLAHSLAMVGFIFLPLGLYGLHVFLPEYRAQGRAFLGFILTSIGVGLTLPFYGAEAFALQVVGQEAIDQNSQNVEAVADAVRFGPAIGFIAVGLILIAAGAVISAWAIMGSRKLPRWSGIPLALGLVLYIPQLSVWASVQSIRVADGLLIAAGCIWLAWSVWKKIGNPASRTTIK